MMFGGVVVYEMIVGVTLNATAITILYSIIAFAINSQGVNAGVSHTNDTVNKVAVAQYPSTPAGQAQSLAATEAAVAATHPSVVTGLPVRTQ